MIYISEHKQILVRVHLHSDESEKRYFSVVLFGLKFGCNFGKINFFILLYHINLTTSSNHLREANG